MRYVYDIIDTETGEILYTSPPIDEKVIPLVENLVETATGIRLPKEDDKLTYFEENPESFKDTIRLALDNASYVSY